MPLHRYLNVIYQYLIETTRRADESFQGAVERLEKALAPPPTQEELDEITAKENARAMQALGGLLGRVG